MTDPENEPNRIVHLEHTIAVLPGVPARFSRRVTTQIGTECGNQRSTQPRFRNAKPRLERCSARSVDNGPLTLAHIHTSYKASNHDAAPQQTKRMGCRRGLTAPTLTIDESNCPERPARSALRKCRRQSGDRAVTARVITVTPPPMATDSGPDAAPQNLGGVSVRRGVRAGSRLR